MSVFLLVLAIWIFSVCLHEYGHAKIAQLGGDYTVEEKGYLSMNPLRYVDPITSIALPILFLVMGGIGLPGGAVYLNRQLLRSRNWETAVSLAGPVMNVILALVLAAFLRFYLIPYRPDHIITPTIAFALQLEISAVLFNLIPIPPLDGYQAIEPWLNNQWREHILPMRGYGMFILFAIFWYVEPVNNFFWSLVFGISNFLGVDATLGIYGYHAFRFWTH